MEGGLPSSYLEIKKIMTFRIGVSFYIGKLLVNKGGFLLENTKIKEVPIWEKSNLTIKEAAAYSGIGENRIKDLSDSEKCPFVLWVGNKRLIKRKRFDAFLENQYSI